MDELWELYELSRHHVFGWCELLFGGSFVRLTVASYVWGTDELAHYLSDVWNLGTAGYDGSRGLFFICADLR